MKVSVHSLERRSLLSVAEALGLMISFGSLIATIIFGILTAVKNDKKTVSFSGQRLFLNSNKTRHRLKRCCRELLAQLLFT